MPPLPDEITDVIAAAAVPLPPALRSAFTMAAAEKAFLG
jgi:hypothetical protein